MEIPVEKPLRSGETLRSCHDCTPLWVFFPQPIRWVAGGREQVCL